MESVPKHKIMKNLRFWETSLKPNYRYAQTKRDEFEKDNELFHNRIGSNRLDRNKSNNIKWGEKDVIIIDNTMKKALGVYKNPGVKEFDSAYIEVVLEIRKRAYKIRTFLNNFINNAPVTCGDRVYSTENQCTCCEQPVGNDISYIQYFQDIDENIVAMTDELFVLQKGYKSLNNCLMTTRFEISTKQTPIPNMSFVQLNLLDNPDSFVNDAFTVYCHVGFSRGEKHYFENDGSENISLEDVYGETSENIEHPDTERCIKCDWYLEKIKRSEFSREDYVSLMNDVNQQSLVDFTHIKTKRKKLNVVSLKRGSTNDKIKIDIEKLAIRIAKSTSNIKDKNTQVKIENFLNNIDNFKNFIPDSDKNSPEKEKIQTITRREKFAVQKMKDYINDFFRKNISRIKWGYKPKSNIDISWVPKKDEEKWQKIIVNDTDWLEPFLTNTNKKLFKKFKFSYTIDNINSIIGAQNVYDETYTAFMRASTFTPRNAVNLVKHYFVKEMLKFFDLSEEGEPIISDFYIKLFEEIEKDRDVINLSEKEKEKWSSEVQHNNDVVKLKYFNAIKEENASLFNTSFRQFADKAYRNPIADPNFETEDPAESIEEIEHEKVLKGQAIKEFENSATDQLVQAYIDDAIEEERIQEEVDKEVYDNHIPKEGEDIIDTGYHYGDPGQGIENEGDGFNDYSMNEIWEPVHAPDVEGKEMGI